MSNNPTNRLLFVRHGAIRTRRSHPPPIVLPPLSERGLTDAGRSAVLALRIVMEDWLDQHGVFVGRVVHTPARRTQQTATLMFDQPREARTIPNSANALADALFEGPGTIAVVGYNPGFISLLNAADWPAADRPGAFPALAIAVRGNGRWSIEAILT